jgi:PEP-CTERM motif
MNSLTQFSLAVCGLVGAMGAQAQYIPVSAVTLDNTLYGGGSAATVVGSGVSSAGAFTGSMSGAPGYSLLSSSNPALAGVGFTFCVEINANIVFGTNPNYEIVNPNNGAGYGSWVGSANASAIGHQIDQLMYLGLANVATAAPAQVAQSFAALQLALWETIQDHSPGYSYSFVTGSFAATGAALPQASALLASLSASTPSPVHYYVLYDGSHQDLLAVAVPEPSSYALMLGGLVGVLALARRRSSGNHSGNNSSSSAR